MRNFSVWHVLIGIFIFGIWSCSSAPRNVSPYYEIPPYHILKGGREMFTRALKRQKNNKMESSIDLWKRYLGNNPRSFKGYNNLGMAHYSNDELSKALSAFETGLALEPQDPKIKDNLKRTLRFQVTLLREEKDYDSAISYLKRIWELSIEPEREKVALEIETLEDKIFAQVKRSNTLESYENFIARYPNSPRNSDEARRTISSMKPQPMKESVSSPDLAPEPLIAEPIETPKSSMPRKIITEDTIEIVAEPEGKMQIDNEFPEPEPPLDPEPAVMEKEIAVEKTEVKNEMKQPSKKKKVTALKPFKKSKDNNKKRTP